MNKLPLYAVLALTSALLAACGSTSVSTPPAQPAQAPTAVSGTLNGWTGGAGSIEMLANGSVSRSATNPVISTGTINADGSFSVALPSGTTVQPYMGPAASLFVPSTDSTCTGGFSSSDAAAKAFVSYGLDVRQNDVYVTSAEPTAFTDQSSGTSLQGTSVDRFWVYADRATLLSGTQDCSSTQPGLSATSHATLNASLNAGWNLMRETNVVSGVQGSGQVTANVSLASTNDASGPWEKKSLGKLSLSPLRVHPYTTR